MTSLDAAALADLVDEDRLVARLLELVAIRSHPGHEAECAEAYAAMLLSAGMRVDIERERPHSGTVIARGPESGGRVLQLAGHLDTVPVDHPPPRLEGRTVYGRGSCDMKAGLVAFAEVAQVLHDAGVALDGSLLVTAYGQHEGSDDGTMHEPLRDLMRRGIRGDAAIVGDCTHGALSLKGKGSLIFDVTFSRPGVPEHELFGDASVANPLQAALRFVAAMEERASVWDAHDRDLGGETFFVGSIESGEIYNTVPTSARLQGTRRYPGPRTFDDVKAELEAVVAATAAEFGVDHSAVSHRSGQPYSVDPSEEIVQCVQRAAELTYGRRLECGVSLYATDLNHIVEIGGIPAVLCGVDGSRAHSTPESVAVDDLVRVTRLYLRTVTEYLGAEVIA